ncbi:hypothetical protein ALP01_200415 [Pseudomonas caricapapayae]|nr:hypothetical protein ALP01_200415 [Pseudomonas caricapapayae]
MGHENFANLFFNRVQRVQRTHGLLKNHRHAIATQAAQLLVAGVNQVEPVITNRALGADGFGGQQAQNRMRGDRLARAGFTHQRQAFATADVEADAMHHFVAVEGDPQVANFNQVVLHVSSEDRMRRGRLHR